MPLLTPELTPHAPHGKAELLSFLDINPPIGDSSLLMLLYCVELAILHFQ